MNNSILLFSLLLIPFLSFAQQSENAVADFSTKGVSIDISGAWSLPLGSYASQDPENKQAGFSKSGFIGGITCDWIGKHDFGIAFQYALQVNPLKNNSGDSILPGMTVPVSSGTWTNHYLMVGPVYMNYFKKILFEARVLVGVILSGSPLFKTQDPAFQTVSNNTGTGFAFGIGAAAGYRLSPAVSLKLNAEFRTGTPKINRQYGAQIIGHHDSAFVYSPPINFDTKKVVSSFNLGLSIIFKIPG
jgi:hypothetical protein